jgi:alkaline phosphatase D
MLSRRFLARGLVVAWSALAPPASAAGQDDDGTPRLMQGPMIGAVTDSSINFWARASGEFTVQIELDEDGNYADARRTVAVTAGRADDYVVELMAEGLEPETTYRYRVLVGGEEAQYLEGLGPFAVRTAPPAGSRTGFRVAIGSCARFQEDPVQPIWEQVERARPDLFIWLGDNIYGDALDPDILAEEYRRQRTVATLQPILRSTPQLATWDDHDFGLNDHDRRNPVKEEALGVFERYWANPAHGLPDAPGVFFRYGYGGVDFFFLDVRYHRDPNAMPDSVGKTMLGAAQLKWLKEGLAASDAPFKVLLSGSGWTKAKGPGGDSWASFLHERDSLFAFIQREGIGGVVLVSGDTHVGELNAIPWSERGGYDFYDLVSSPLAQSPSASWLERRPEIRIRPIYSAGPNAGLLTFDFEGEPTLTYRLIAEDGRSPWPPFVITASELQNGVRSWTEKISPSEQERLERYQRGEGYYEVPRP